MTGEELAAEVQRRFPSLPVIIASGYGKSASPQAGGLRFIGKPYSSIDLQQALDEVARKAGATLERHIPCNRPGRGGVLSAPDRTAGAPS